MKRYVVTVPATFEVEVVARNRAEADRRARHFRDWLNDLGGLLLAGSEEGVQRLDPPETTEAFRMTDHEEQQLVQVGSIETAERPIQRESLGYVMRQRLRDGASG
ncbi:MAG TPA: hypothetical protein VHS28_01460 [Chloroflexota bacterium]|nr:hypothetical protein [Chloroflexota bacterium]